CGRRVRKPEPGTKGRAGRAGQMPRAAWRRRAAAREESLTNAILERVEGHDCEPAPSLEQPLGGGKPARKFLELLIEVKTQRLEGARRRVLGLVALAPEHAGNDVRQLLRRLDRRFGAPCHD